MPYREEELSPELKQVKKEVMDFVYSMRAMTVVVGERDFYMILYYLFQESFDPDVDVMAVTYRDTASLGLPRILYGKYLVKYINSILEKVPDIADEYIKKIKNDRSIPAEYDEKLKKYYIFREIVKHEVIHYINLHVPRTHEFFRKMGYSEIPSQLMQLANIYADSICNVFLDKRLVEEGGLVPPITENVTLEELLKKAFLESKTLPPNWKFPQWQPKHSEVDLGEEDQNKGQGQKEGLPSSEKGEGQSLEGQEGEGRGKGQGGKKGKSYGEGEGEGGGQEGQKKEKGFGQGGFRDFYPKEFDEVGQHDIGSIKDAVRDLIERARDIFKRHGGIGSIPNEIEELVKWLKRRKIKLELIDEDNELFGLFKQHERTYMDYNPIRNKRIWRFRRRPIFPVIRQLTGYTVVIIVDTSASMGGEDLSYAFDLINELASKARTYLVEIDAEIQRVREVDEVDQDEISFKGRGGTSFKDLERLDEYITNEDVTACIILTDGRVDEFPSENPFPGAKWYGITVAVIPDKSPDWIKWFKVEDVLGEEEEEG
jgi:predicted metal-dependent peptidase